MTMIKSPVDNNIGSITESNLKSQYDLFFGFEAICECDSSMEVMEGDKHRYKKLMQACLQLTKFHSVLNKLNNTLDVKGKTSPKEYKKLSGDGINGYIHKFKLDKANSVLVSEEINNDENKLYIRLAKAGNFHQK